MSFEKNQNYWHLDEMCKIKMLKILDAKVKLNVVLNTQQFDYTTTHSINYVKKSNKWL